MTQIIFRAFATAAQAESAIREMRAAGVGRQFVTVVSPPTGVSETEARAQIVGALQKAQIQIARAQTLAPRVLNGETILVVAAPFGFAMPAINSMEDSGGVIIGAPEPGERYIAVGEIAALFSEIFSLPVLAKSGPILSNSLGLPTLLKSGKALGFGHLVGANAKSYTGFLGLPLLAGSRAASYTGLLGLPLLSKSDGPYKGFLGLPLLTRKS
jgi:hypothetical protein